MNHLSGRPILKMINRQTLYMEVHYPPVDHFFNNSTPGRVNASGIIDIHSEIKINEPFHGAILNWRHGEKTDNGLKIRVKGTAPVNQKVIVNGVIAQRNDTMFTAEIIIEDKETEITATAGDYLGQKSHSIRVIWDRNSFPPRYSLNIDDNIFFLRDIARKKIHLTLRLLLSERTS